MLFKVGDIIKCIENGRILNYNYSYEHVLTKDKLYEVLRSTDIEVEVLGDHGKPIQIYSSRFILPYEEEYIVLDHTRKVKVRENIYEQLFLSRPQ